MFCFQLRWTDAEPHWRNTAEGERMIEKICYVLEEIPMLAVAGLCLLASFILERGNVGLPLDPAWLTVLICGFPIVCEAVEALFEKKGISKITSALLISTAMIAAILIDDLFAAGEVAFIMAIGELLEDMTTERAKKGLHKLLALTPKMAHVLRDGVYVEIPAEEVTVGDIVRILPGETVPTDGVIESGETAIDQSVITGEAIPVDCGAGDAVYSGTVNCFGSITVKVTKIAEDSCLQRMIQLVRRAEQEKAPMERTADRYASILVPIALLIAVVTYLVTGNIIRGVTVLVVFCPCALVLATPTAIMAAVGQATKHGVIIKSGEALEKMGEVDTIAFDKTGTLTIGKPAVSDVVALADISEEELLQLAATAEEQSEHPLGKAITAYAKERGIRLLPCTEFRMTSGRGIEATVDGRAVLCGNEQFLREHGTEVSAKERERISDLTETGKVVVILADKEKLLGLIALSDTLRDDVKATIEELRKNGVEACLLTGDRLATAQYLAKQAGIRELRAELLPEQKVAAIREFSENGRLVCMVGDGVNDAPALKTAAVGVAMGGIGSDIAVEAADLALVSDDISRILYLKKLAVKTVRTIKLGITLSMMINLAAVLLSVLGILTPTTGALVHNAGSVFVVLIAAGLYDRTI